MSIEGQTTNIGRNRATIVMVVGGFIFVGAGAWVAQHYDVWHRLMLDIYGTHGMATAEPIGTNQYRLRLSIESTIYARRYTGKLQGGNADSNAEFSVPVVYSPDDPGRFLPAGRSYVTAAIAVVLFVVGMSFVLSARRVAMAAVRMQKLAQQRAEEERRQSRHRKHRQHGQHHHRHPANR